ncbi:glycerol-3-phosphate dehydrogenase/oxidase [Prosthecobacter sp.]|uniref:glycerol-3-phosphate dehydrogenase/oxidase n=1 Tax=Prosthecobacter sp. TaxID=1965333 RepID=UPI002AB809DD|nr:glycerol-3-phosphate dehydrogenase/oxidase [Prosthecobacter sp.]MDZ4401272.1 glycerol-3-phosphate dehydrogenase/oxidase [Prosthecobacter sp.]
MNRERLFSQLVSHSGPFDIAIIGGGATGLGAAVDAASRGHSVVLIEQSDFAKGTSSRSTKLVHGGVRYLKQGNISLVLEALRERGLLCKNAPHLVHSLPFVIPSYHWWEGPFYGIGLKVYDTLAGQLGLEPSRYLSREEMMELLPTLETEGLDGGVVYHDGQFDDARLAIHLARTAVNNGAITLNHTRCTGLMKEKGHVIGVKAECVETGRQHEIRARCVINATGVFVDDVRRMDDAKTENIVAPSQGVHLVLPREFLPGESAIMIPKTDDGRVLFAVPWHGRVIIGTTDTPVEHASIEPRALPDEIEFLMTHAARYLTRDPRPCDVLSVFAGLRPLVAAKNAESTAALSRDHTILVSDSGLITITGGKWTTYRRMAEDVIDHAEMIGGIGVKHCVTHDLKIHGSATVLPKDDPLAVYGSDATEIRELTAKEPEWARKVHPKLDLTCAEVVFHTRHEMARTVGDVLARRSRSLLFDAQASMNAAPRVAAIMARELNWDAETIDHQVNRFQKLASGYILEG